MTQARQEQRLANPGRLRRASLAALVVASLLAAALLWLPFRPPYLYSEDCINFARALQKFDPAASRPQWPGYPLFVAQSRVLHTLFSSVENAFLADVIIGTAISFVFIVLLGRELGGCWEAGFTAVLLFIANPAFLFTGLTSTIRIYLAAISSAVAYFCWRMCRNRSHLWPTVALGIGSGYRPELIAVLLPLWAYTAWRTARARRDFFRAAILLALLVLGWVAILVYFGPPLAEMPMVLNAYLAGQAANTSPLYGASLQGWASMLARLAAWNGMAIFGWIAFAPFIRPKLPAGAGRFLVLCVCPALLFHALIHIGAADQALVAIPIFCLIGGVVLTRLIDRNFIVGFLALLLALSLNLKTFFRPISMHPERSTAALQFFREQFTEALWKMSLPVFRDVETHSEQSLGHIRESIRAGSGPVLIVWEQSQVIWQKVSYYFPNQDIWVIARTAGQSSALRYRDCVLLERRAGAPVRIPLRGASRIVWIVPAESIPANTPDLDVQCPDANTCWAAAKAASMPGYDLIP